MKRNGYPSDVTDEEWAFVLPYLCLMSEEAPQREYPLRQVFNALRYLTRTGAPWRYLPQELPPWKVVYDQTQRWLRAGVFESMVHDLRALLRVAQGRAAHPTAAILDGRTLHSTPESGHRAGFDGHKKKNGSKVHVAVDTLGHLLAVVVTPANEQERAQVSELAQAVQEVTGQNVQLAYNWPMLTRATPVKMPQRRLWLMAWNSKWSNSKKPSGALCCCRAGGWSSVLLPGRLASAVWLKTMSDCLKPLLACTSWLLLVSCSLSSSPSSKVKNTL